LWICDFKSRSSIEVKTENNMGEPEQFGIRKKLPRITLVLTAVLLVFWAGITASIQWWFTNNAGTAGDSFGAVNALFSGFALAGVVVAILLQSEDLREQSTALFPSSRNCARF